MSEEEPGEILEGADLCLCCVEPVRPGASLCGNCGAPQDFIAGTLPFLKVLAAGFVYRRAIQTPRSWLSVFGIWLIFGPLAVSGGLIMWWWVPMMLEHPDFERFTQGLPYLAHALVGALGVVSSTVNHLAYRRSVRASV